MGKTVTVGSGCYAGETNAAIQRAIDEVAAEGGGTVEVPAGRYAMHDSLHLRDNVRVCGEAGTVLFKVPSVSSAIRGWPGYGFHEVMVREPERFEVGMGVLIQDDRAMGFYETVATIIAKEGAALFLNRMLNHDYGDNGRVTSVYPLVAGYGVTNATAENLTLDGNPEETHWLNGCRGGGVFLLGSHAVTLKTMEVQHYQGDAISFQQCVDIRVSACHLHDNAGGGLHPGSGSVRYIMEGCHIHHNGGHGIYYCLRTTHSICADNHIEHNARPGISIGERDTDHLLRGNRIEFNGEEGIRFRAPVDIGGERVRIEANIIGPNCQQSGESEIIIPAGLKDIAILGNTFPSDRRKAVQVASPNERLAFAENNIAGCAQSERDVSGAIAMETPTEFPPVGPAALPLDGARHLGITRLPAWTT